MGCCSYNPKALEINQIIIRIQKLILNSSTHEFNRLLKYLVVQKIVEFSVDDFLFESEAKIVTNLAGHSVLHGNLAVFKILSEEYFVSTCKMELTFSVYGLSAVAVLCIKGFSDFLRYYLKICIADPLRYAIKTDFKIFSALAERNINHEYTPVQFACICENINCIQEILSFIHGKIAPWWLDINFQDPITGENCAFLACKFGNFSMIKYLYTKCNADFSILNNRNENVLQVFLISCNYYMIPQVLSIVKYLMEVIKIDVTHAYEETLLLCGTKEVTILIEAKLNSLQIFAKKSDLEAEIKFPDEESLQSIENSSIFPV